MRKILKIGTRQQGELVEVFGGADVVRTQAHTRKNQSIVGHVARRMSDDGPNTSALTGDDCVTVGSSMSGLQRRRNDGRIKRIRTHTAIPELQAEVDEHGVRVVSGEDVHDGLAS